jgi:hypothetical protein
LAWQAEQQLKCPGCGLSREDTMAVEADDAYAAEPIRCHACAARDRASKSFAQGGEGMAAGDTAGLYFTVNHRNGSR